MWAHCATNFYNMLADSIKTSTLFKNFKGWGSTHEKREVFEELYRAFNSISTGSVLTYGDLLPRVETDQYFQQVKNLPYSEPDNLITHRESSYNKEVPLIKKMRVKLTAISPHCDDAFAVLVDGEQVKNIIPFDYSDTGIYNYTLETAAGKPIPFGIGDWMLDVNSAILTFNNGVPEGVTGENTPYLTFYQYVGPVGETPVEFNLTSDALMYDMPDEEVISYYDQTSRTWAIDPSEYEVEGDPITLYVPTLEKDANIKAWMIRKLQENRNTKIDPVFIRFVSWMTPKISKDDEISKRQIIQQTRA